MSRTTYYKINDVTFETWLLCYSFVLSYYLDLKMTNYYLFLEHVYYMNIRHLTILNAF